jgi:hypothetical protein
MYLVRDDNRTLYELGKARSGLHAPFEKLADRRTGTFVLSDPEILAEMLLDGILEHGCWAPGDYRPLAAQLAERTIRWSGGRAVRLDGEDGVDDLKYRPRDRYIVTDSRYSGEFAYYDVFQTLGRELQEQIDQHTRVQNPTNEFGRIRSFGVANYTRLGASEKCCRGFLMQMAALRPLQLAFCDCGCHDNPTVCTEFDFCCQEVNAPRAALTPKIVV